MAYIAVTGREQAAVLAGLRLLQLHQRAEDLPESIVAIGTDVGEYRMLTDKELDTLCQRVNNS